MDSPWAKYARIDASAKASTLACLLPAACCVLVAGCNNGRQLQADLYQRELRLQEDEIYRLEDYVSEYQEIIRGYRCELAEVRQQLAEKQRYSGSGNQPTETLPEPTPAPPDTPEPLDLDQAGGDIMPEIEMPEPDVEAAPAAGGTAPKASEAPKFEPAPLFDSSSSEAHRSTGTRLASLEAAADTPPAPYPFAPEAKPIQPPTGLDGSIALSLQPGPINKAGPTTLTAVVTEATAGSLADFRGVASIMLTDPAVEGGRRRIARWDFTPEEVADALMVSGGRLVELPIALPESLPSDQSLRVWVRLTTHRGVKRLQATTVRLTGKEGRIDLASLTPRLLPPVQSATEPAAFALADDQTATPISEWRPAGELPRNRRIDPALQTASFDEE